MVKNSSWSNGWRTKLEIKQLWEDDTHIQYEIILSWEANGSRRLYDKNAQGKIDFDGKTVARETFSAMSLNKEVTVFVVSTLQKVEKKSYSYNVKIEGEVSISGYGYPYSVSVSDTIKVNEKQKQSISKPLLSTSESCVHYGHDVTLSFKRAESQGAYSFNKFEVIQMLSDGKEKILYSGTSSSWRFTPSKYDERFLTLKLKEVHYGGEYAFSDQIGISISNGTEKIFDYRGGRPTVIIGRSRRTIVLADFY